jgi:hypothetical protein
MEEKRTLSSKQEHLRLQRSGQSQRNKTTEREAKDQMEELDDDIHRVRDETREWKRSFAKESARLGPLLAQRKLLQEKLRTFKGDEGFLRTVFDQQDIDGNGRLAKEEVVETLRKLTSGDDDEGSDPLLKDPSSKVEAYFRKVPNCAGRLEGKFQKGFAFSLCRDHFLFHFSARHESGWIHRFRRI